MLEEPQTTWMLAVITLVWLLLVVWMDVTVALVLTVGATSLPAGLCWWLGAEPALVAFGGMGLLTFTFVLLTRAALILFGSGHQVPAVASIVLKEATRSRISLVFVLLLLVILPLLPIWLDPETPLRFRIQTFISRSLGVTYVLAACMTLFLSCSTVAFEIRDRQIWQLMTKPLGRFNYLAGKWLGVITLNLIILLVAGVSIFAYVKYLSQSDVAYGREGALDRLAVRDEILTARIGAVPVLEELTNEQVRARVEQMIERDPELSKLEEVPRARKNQLALELIQNHEQAQRSVPPLGGEQTYTFRNLGRAKSLQSTLTLRYRFHILRDDEHETFPVAFVFNDRIDAPVQRMYFPTVTHLLSISTDAIRDNGTMDVTVVNLYRPLPTERGRGALNFEADGFELLYKVGRFEANFFRAVLITWVKLAFLAMLGIACATLLSFPVACLFAFTIFLAGTIGPFLAIALSEYYPPDPTTLDWTNFGQVMYWAVKSLTRGIAQVLVYLLGRFGGYRPTQSLVEGRLIPWQSVAGGIWWLGVIWSGIAATFGYLVIRNRQLAIYSGHG
ncbi:MAG: hypothetical protein O7B29_08100, partial [Deltaproteobacteria bacterium]|nr:hypothetical protein [Deltaproteobacteria bacterium]